MGLEGEPWTHSIPMPLPLLTPFSDSRVLQEFSLQRMDSLVDDRVNILGFSIFNQSHAFFQEFAQSLNQSWQENCDHVPFTGPAVSTRQSPVPVCLLPHVPSWGPARSRPPLRERCVPVLGSGYKGGLGRSEL